MANDKKPTSPNPEQQQTTQSGEKHINPFKDTANEGAAPTPQEEIELEQQRKEALTERD